MLGVNNFCNLHCRMCDVGTGNDETNFGANLVGAKTRSMSLELFRRVVDEMIAFLPPKRNWDFMPSPNHWLGAPWVRHWPMRPGVVCMPRSRPMACCCRNALMNCDLPGALAVSFGRSRIGA